MMMMAIIICSIFMIVLYQLPRVIKVVKVSVVLFFKSGAAIPRVSQGIPRPLSPVAKYSALSLVSSLLIVS